MWIRYTTKVTDVACKNSKTKVASSYSGRWNKAGRVNSIWIHTANNREYWRKFEGAYIQTWILHAMKEEGERR